MPVLPAQRLRHLLLHSDKDRSFLPLDVQSFLNGCWGGGKGLNRNFTCFSFIKSATANTVVDDFYEVETYKPMVPKALSFGTGLWLIGDAILDMGASCDFLKSHSHVPTAHVRNTTVLWDWTCSLPGT